MSAGGLFDLREIPEEERENLLVRIILVTMMALRTHLSKIVEATQKGDLGLARAHLMACASHNAVLGATVKIPSIQHATDQTQALLKEVIKEVNQVDLLDLQMKELQAVLDKAIKEGGPN